MNGRGTLNNPLRSYTQDHLRRIISPPKAHLQVQRSRRAKWQAGTRQESHSSAKVIGSPSSYMEKGALKAAKNV